jgi:hypothetical protein
MLEPQPGFARRPRLCLRVCQDNFGNFNEMAQV